MKVNIFYTKYLTDWNGSIGRAEFFVAQMVLWAICIVIRATERLPHLLLSNVISASDWLSAVDYYFAAITILCETIITFVGQHALTIRRLNDIGLPKKWVLIYTTFFFFSTLLQFTDLNMFFVSGAVFIMQLFVWFYAYLTFKKGKGLKIQPRSIELIGASLSGHELGNRGVLAEGDVIGSKTSWIDYSRYFIFSSTIIVIYFAGLFIDPVRYHVFQDSTFFVKGGMSNTFSFPILMGLLCCILLSKLFKLKKVSSLIFLVCTLLIFAVQTGNHFYKEGVASLYSNNF